MRPRQYCPSCERTVYADDVHSCYDAKALRAQLAREREARQATTQDTTPETTEDPTP